MAFSVGLVVVARTVSGQPRSRHANRSSWVVELHSFNVRRVRGVSLVAWLHVTEIDLLFWE